MSVWSWEVAGSHVDQHVIIGESRHLWVFFGSLFSQLPGKVFLAPGWLRTIYWSSRAPTVQPGSLREALAELAQLGFLKDGKGYRVLVEGSLEVKLPTIWTNEKQRWEESEKRREEERRSKKRKSQKKEDPGARKQAPQGRKVGSLKRRVRSPLGRWEMNNCTPLWREDARSTCRSQNVQSTPGSDHFWKLRCRKSARRCGAKHISKSKC